QERYLSSLEAPARCGVCAGLSGQPESSFTQGRIPSGADYQPRDLWTSATVGSAREQRVIYYQGPSGGLFFEGDMIAKLDRQMLWIFGALLGLLVVASIVGFVLSLTARSESGKATVKNLNARIIAWWKMSGIFALTILMGPHGSILLFALISF